MPISRRLFHASLIALLVFGLWPLIGAGDDLVEGRDWRPLKTPITSDDPEKIEVLEFFSYGCPHCSHLNPLLKDWAAKLPEDVALRRVPVTFGRAAWANLARLYYALELNHLIDALDQATFDAISKERKRLFTDKAIFAWIKEQGQDAEAFEKTFNSFAVELALGKGRDLEERVGVDAVPRLIVDGRYVVLNEDAQGYEELLRRADTLIERARKERQ
ncbi:thiol:disulfide interchange protein DsbA/DsbL [Thiorhodovibrio frisius]|uniref:Thiol:disulfide interchange protein n=1 Tax=Thiorhodovibrio frisius TaxID=631362 RepID=H8Z7E2_9GAMM|nr:thiol:disulfide interchange protein DsbA/DsbL [Thiorhodovibrio frisius]EIC19858.1 protein-disulfide isomerase [Thiorhodovibrio frisius]WPL20586.1 Thiol:disulfide interchange protein DsbA precursor [Thiorhodovibrio frisius]